MIIVIIMINTNNVSLLHQAIESRSSVQRVAHSRTFWSPTTLFHKQVSLTLPDRCTLSPKGLQVALSEEATIAIQVYYSTMASDLRVSVNVSRIS
jgi:hypothetical protein